MLSTGSNQTYFDIKETAKNTAANNYFGICNTTQKRIKLDLMDINLLSNNEGINSEFSFRIHIKTKCIEMN